MPPRIKRKPAKSKSTGAKPAKSWGDTPYQRRKAAYRKWLRKVERENLLRQMTPKQREQIKKMVQDQTKKSRSRKY